MIWNLNTDTTTSDNQETIQPIIVQEETAEQSQIIEEIVEKEIYEDAPIQQSEENKEIIEDIPVNIIHETNTKTTTTSNINTTQTKKESGGQWYTCWTKTKCGQMNTCGEARYYLNTCGVKSLDRDKDWVPCESLCW
jgi:hypothetical protein